MKQTIRKGDRVRVMRGDKADVDKVGEVIRVMPKESRVVVQGVNMVKKHQKQQQRGDKTLPSGIMEFEAPVHISNVQLVTEASEKETKARASKRTTADKAAAAKKPAAKAEKAVSEKKAEKPAAKKTTASKPASEKTTTKKTAAPKAAAEKAPAAKKPAAKKTTNK